MGINYYDVARFLVHFLPWLIAISIVILAGAILLKRHTNILERGNFINFTILVSLIVLVSSTAGFIHYSKEYNSMREFNEQLMKGLKDH